MGQGRYTYLPCYHDTPSLPCDKQAGIGLGVGIFLNYLRKQVVGEARQYIESKSTYQGEINQ